MKYLRGKFQTKLVQIEFCKLRILSRDKEQIRTGPLREPISQTRGYTLIELLVTIAIIAILASLLLPSLNQVTKVAQRTTCLNNFKQSGLAMHNYTGDWSDFLPLSVQRTTENAAYWPTLLATYLGGGDWNYGGWSPDTPKAVVSLFQCPSGPEEIERQMNIMYHKRCGNFWNGAPPTGLPWCGAKRIRDVKDPSGAVIMLDGANRTYTPENVFDLGMPNGLWSPVWVDFRHNMGINALFLDGHAGWIKYPWGLPAEAVGWAN
ncbi:MAG: DUF1559 domain-containing protein [Deltaproteobacteria bacterium]|nr:DUF1559 domain-containing protein [Deltaproteobacteria bacterium]